MALLTNIYFYMRLSRQINLCLSSLQVLYEINLHQRQRPLNQISPDFSSLAVRKSALAQARPR